MRPIPRELAGTSPLNKLIGMARPKSATCDGIKRASAAKSFEVAFYYSCGGLEKLWRLTPRLSCAAQSGIAALMQACPPKTFEVVFTIAVVLERHVFGDPGERNIGLRAAKIVQCTCGGVSVA